MDAALVLMVSRDIRVQKPLPSSKSLERYRLSTISVSGQDRTITLGESLDYRNGIEISSNTVYQPFLSADRREQ
jgi:hypothetical protein